jgi:hypothetical protein
MMAFILSALGSFGGLGLLGYGARIMGWDRKVVRFGKSITPRGWLYIGIIAAVLGGLVWHVVHEHRRFNAAVKAAYRQGAADYAGKVEQQALHIADRANALVGPINSAIRDRHNAELGRINALGDALRVSGPGKAECRDPAFAAASGGRQQASGPADAAVDRLPYPQWSALLAMPHDDATRFAEQHDAYRDEVKSWHEWWPRMNEAWEKLRSSVAQKETKR